MIVRELVEKALNPPVPDLSAVGHRPTIRVQANAIDAQIAADKAEIVRLRELLEWRPTHVHIKSRGLYMKVCDAEIEADLSKVVIYRASTGRTWVRPEAEFIERFMPLRSLPPLGDPPKGDE
jgi:hypothetical protein